MSPMITGEVGLDGVPGAFEALADPDEHCKILRRSLTASVSSPIGASARSMTIA